MNLTEGMRGVAMLTAVALLLTRVGSVGEAADSNLRDMFDLQ
jgi:hypothetical protein